MSIDAAVQVAAGGKAGITIHDNARIRYAEIRDGKVVNMIIGPENWAPDGMTLVAVPDGSPVEIGWSFADEEFVAPSV
jgi:hypothetical protein